MNPEGTVGEATQVVATTQQNAIAVFMPRMFSDVNFSTLNGAISALAARPENALSDADKESARGIILSWNNSVLEAIDNKLNYMRSVSNFFQEKTGYYHNSSTILADDEELALAQATDTMQLYSRYLEEIEAQKDHLDSKPEKPEYALNTSIEDKLESESAYDLSITKYNIEKNRLERSVASKQSAWKREMRNHPYVKEMLSKVRKFENSIRDLKNEAKQKSQLAILNISIDTPETRESLRQMIEFSITI